MRLSREKNYLLCPPIIFNCLMSRGHRLALWQWQWMDTSRPLHCLLGLVVCGFIDKPAIANRTRSLTKGDYSARWRRLYVQIEIISSLFIESGMFHPYTRQPYPASIPPSPIFWTVRTP